MDEELVDLTNECHHLNLLNFWTEGADAMKTDHQKPLGIEPGIFLL